MGTRVKLSAIGSVAGVILMSGTACSGPGRTPGIPLGQWRGQGVVAYDNTDEEKEIPEVQRRLSRRYDTRLSIQRGQVEGQDAIILEIHSNSGVIPVVSKGQVHLRVGLREVQTLGQNTVLYRLVSRERDPESGQPPVSDKDAGAFAATCTTAGGAITCVIEYDDNFVDTLRFEGRSLHKTGTCYKADSINVQWVEQLTRTD